MAAEDSIGKVASLCVRALLEFIGWLGVLAWRLAGPVHGHGLGIVFN